MTNAIPGYQGPKVEISVPGLPQGGESGGGLEQVGKALLSAASRINENQRLVLMRAASRQGLGAGASGPFSMADESTPEGRAFNDAAMQAYGVQKDLYVRQRLFDLKTQYPNDLSSFDARAKSAIDTMTAEMRKVAPSMVAERQQRWAFLASQYRGQIAETVANQQSAQQKADILALTRQTNLEIDEHGKDFFSADPNLSTQTFLSAMRNWSELSDHYDRIGANGLPLFSPAEKEEARETFFDRFYASELMAWVDANPDKTKAYADLRDGKVRAKINAIDAKTGEPTEQIVAMDPKRELSRETYDNVLKYAKARMTDAVAMHRLERQAPLWRQTENENFLKDMLDNPNIPEREKVLAIKTSLLNGDIDKDFGARLLDVLSARKVSRSDIADTAKLAAFQKLTDKLGELRVAFGKKATEKISGDIDINEKGIKAFREYQSNVLDELGKKTISESEAKKLLGGVTDAVTKAIENKKTLSLFGRVKTLPPGIQDPYGEGLDKIDEYLKSIKRENDIALKRELFLTFSEYLGHFDEKNKDKYVADGNYKSTLSLAQDTDVIEQALKLAKRNLNKRNFAGTIDPDNPPNGMARLAKSKSEKAKIDAKIEAIEKELGLDSQQ